MLRSILLCCIAVVGLTSGHVCVLSPSQRGPTTNINVAAARECSWTTPPCGGQSPDVNSGTALVAGKNVTVVIQKNNNHYSDTPGYFTVSIGADESNFRELQRIPDTKDPSLTLYTTSITVPQTTGHMILQVAYVTNITPTFYQCSDVTIVTNSGTVVVG